MWGGRTIKGEKRGREAGAGEGGSRDWGQRLEGGGRGWGVSRESAQRLFHAELTESRGFHLLDPGSGGFFSARLDAVGLRSRPELRRVSTGQHDTHHDRVSCFRCSPA